MGPGDDDRRLNSPESFLAPCGVQINATVPVRTLEFARKRHNVPGPKREDYSLKGFEIERKMS